MGRVAQYTTVCVKMLGFLVSYKLVQLQICHLLWKLHIIVILFALLLKFRVICKFTYALKKSQCKIRISTRYIHSRNLIHNYFILQQSWLDLRCIECFIKRYFSRSIPESWLENHF